MSEGGGVGVLEARETKTSGASRTIVERRSDHEVAYTRKGETLVIQEDGNGNALHFDFEHGNAQTGKAETNLPPKKYNVLSKANHVKREVTPAPPADEAASRPPRKPREVGHRLKVTPDSTIPDGEIACSVEDDGTVVTRVNAPKGSVRIRVLSDRLRLNMRKTDGKRVAADWVPDDLRKVQAAVQRELEEKESRKAARAAAREAKKQPETPAPQPQEISEPPSGDTETPLTPIPPAEQATPIEVAEPTQASSDTPGANTTEHAEEPAAESHLTPSEETPVEAANRDGTEPGMIVDPEAETGQPENTEAIGKESPLAKKTNRGIKRILRPLAYVALPAIVLGGLVAGYFGTKALPEYNPLNPNQNPNTGKNPGTGQVTPTLEPSTPTPVTMDHVIQSGENPWNLAQQQVIAAESQDHSIQGVDTTAATEAVMQTEIAISANRPLEQKIGFDFKRIVPEEHWNLLTPQAVDFLLHTLTHRVRGLSPNIREGIFAARGAMQLVQAEEQARKAGQYLENPQPGSEVYNNPANERAAEAILNVLNLASQSGIL